MWGKIVRFFKGFFGNVKVDPMSSLKGVVELAAAGATCYGMATGVVPTNAMSMGFASSSTVAGIHALGTNNTTSIESPVVAKMEQVVGLAANVAGATLSVVDRVTAMKAEADEGQRKVDTYNAVTQALAAIVPPPQ